MQHLGPGQLDQRRDRQVSSPDSHCAQETASTGSEISVGNIKTMVLPSWSRHRQGPLQKDIKSIARTEK